MIGRRSSAYACAYVKPVLTGPRLRHTHKHQLKKNEHVRSSCASLVLAFVSIRFVPMNIQLLQ